MKNQKINADYSISLIITTYNRPDALELVLISILQQTEYPTEIIIADDGSAKTTQKLVEKYQKKMPIPLRHCWHSDKGFRLATIRNKAIVMATGEYLIMIDGDMVLHKSFIKDHKNMVRQNAFVQGKRVLLGQKLSLQAIQNQQIEFNFFHKEVKNKLNTLRMPFLANWLLGPTHPTKGVRGCNMAFWRKDVILINGFNEDFVGWGREDSEFVARLSHAGIKRINFKFGAIAYHLYHENQKKMTPKENDALLEKTLAQKSVWCERGIKQYL